jgi:hypothetical protein
LFIIGSLSNWTFLPSNFTSSEPGPMNFVGPCVFADISPPPVLFDAMSPWLLKLAPLTATGFFSTFTSLVYFFGDEPLLPMFGSGVGTNGAGGPGILQTLGNVAAARPLLPVVTGVLGGFTLTVAMAYVRA